MDFRANDEVEGAKRQSESEIARLQAFVKKSELRISSLEKQLNQKVRFSFKITNQLFAAYQSENECFNNIHLDKPPLFIDYLEVCVFLKVNN